MSDIDEDISEGYSQEEINQARDELKNLTPEDYLALQGELIRAHANQNMPEAVSICFTEVFTSKGNRVSITCRGMTGRQAIDELADVLRYAREKYNMHVGHVPIQQPPDESEPVYVDVNPAPTNATGTTVDDIQVTTITRERKRDGKGDFLRVRGGPYTKYGAPAYDNVFPKTFDITKMTYGVEAAPPTGMMNAKVQADVDQDGRKSKAKVITFS
jgi:hypothetical protein